MVKENFDFDGDDVFEEDIDLDDVPVDNDDAVDEQEKPETIEKVAAPNSDEVEQLRRELAESRQERDRIAKEREEIAEEVETARKATIESAISNMQNELSRENDEITALHQKLERAKIDGDADKTDAFILAISKKMSVINQLNNNINNANYQLSQRRSPVKNVDVKTAPTADETYANEVAIMANKWLEANSWYNDPAQEEKKASVLAAYNKARTGKYDMTRMEVWEHLNKVRDAFDSKATEKRRTPPAVRPVGSNNNNGGAKTVSNNKINQAALAEADKFMAMYDKTPESLGQKKYVDVRKRAYLSELKKIKQSNA